jgi:hypothetical protein
MDGWVRYDNARNPWRFQPGNPTVIEYEMNHGAGTATGLVDAHHHAIIKKYRWCLQVNLKQDVGRRL